MQSHHSRKGAVPPLVLLTCCFFLHGLAGPGAAATGEDVGASSTEAGSYSLDESLLQEEVSECLGIPYQRGGSTPAGMDCSGFSRHIYSRLFGLELPHKASEQYRLGIFRDTSQEPLQMGDLIFFRKRDIIEHVGIYLSEGRFVHAVGGKGVVISSLENRYWKSILAGSRRLIGLRSQVVEPPWEGSTFLFEIGYQGYLAENLMKIRLSAFWERPIFEDAVAAFPLTFSRETSPFGAPPEPQSVFRNGLSLAGEIGLFQGVRIRPFFTLFEGVPGVGEGRDARTGFGLEAFLTPPVGSYDLSVAVDYGDPAESALRPLQVTGGVNALSMSLRFQYRVTDLMRISFAGQHAFEDLSAPRVHASVRGGAPSDLFLLFDFTH